MSQSKVLIFLATILVLAVGVQSACQYWDGTAPFCKGGCPSSCRTLARSNCSNGACCWSGHKELCECCPGESVCKPTETKASCYGVFLVCKNQQTVITITGPVTTTCSTYVCGICFDFGSFLNSLSAVQHVRREVGRSFSTFQNDTCLPELNATCVDPMLRDIYVQGNKTLSEKDIECKLEEHFGPKLTPQQMKHIKAVKINNPDPSIGDRDSYPN